MLPARAGSPSSKRRDGTTDSRKHAIAYLFAGTYGDFVQILKTLNRLAAAFPQSDIILWGGRRYIGVFASELPASLRTARAYEPWLWLLNPVDLLFVNCVGVYRVRFDFAARFCARAAYGFRHSHEEGRGGFALTIPLAAEVRSFAEENRKLLDLAGVPDGGGPGQGEPVAEPAWGEGEILFLIGSAGLKKDFGLDAYARLVIGILEMMSDRSVEVVAGPEDEDIAGRVRANTAFAPKAYPLDRLTHRLRSFKGTVLCFNSFSAHICHYLGRSALVLHRDAVPFGYDCAPLHRQIVLRSERNWDLGELRQALDEGRF